MKEVKRWAIIKNQLDEADYIWIKNNSNQMTVNHKTTDIPSFSKEFSRVYVGSEVILTTTTEEQEAMLRLKYDNKLVLLTVVFLEPGQVYHDHFGEMYVPN